MIENDGLPQSVLPGGTVTFLFTDIEGSTNLLNQLRDRYADLLAGHHQIIRRAIDQWHGREVDTQGDAFFAAFPKATEAVAAVADIQRALTGREWPGGVQVRVRMGLHTGEPWLVEEGYVGMDVHRAARIGHTGHGRQVLLSETTTALVVDELPDGVSLLDLGHHRLKDMRRPEHIHQLVIEGLPADFPPLKSLEVITSPATPEVAQGREVRQVGPSPYRGLAAFRESDAGFFFGREAFTEQLAQVVRERGLVAVIVGPSGSGKSSAVFAGLLPQLRHNGRWLIVEARPGDRPFYALADALLPALEENLTTADRLIESQKLAQALRAGELPLFQIVNMSLKRQPEAKRMLLVIDQFEELFTLRSDPEDQRIYLDELLAAAKSGAAYRRSPLVLLLTLRADFMGQALTHRPFADALQEGSLILGPMNRRELQAAVEKPAELQGAAFEPGLVQRILDDVGQEPGNLPLLEFALTLLWERMENGWLTHTAYEEIGRVDGALARYADEVYAELDQMEKESARRLFVQLVQPGEGTEDTRRVARRTELALEIWPLVQHLADQRLVVTGQDESGEETVEVVHEALIRGWDRLRTWMREDRAFRTWQEGLRAALRSWEGSSRDEGALLRGAPLAMALDWLVEHEHQMSLAEKVFIEASRQESEKQAAEEETRRQRELETSLKAQKQAAILLAAQAETELKNGFPDRALLLALEALENYPYTPQAEHALGQAVSYNRALQQYTGHSSAVTSVDWSPDGKRIASSSTDNTVHVWDTFTAEEHIVIELPKGITGNIYDWALTVKWTPDGDKLLTLSGDRFLLGSQDYNIILWDATTGEQIRIIELPNQAVPEAGEGKNTSGDHYATATAASFALKSGRLATVGGDDTAIIWDASLETPVFILDGHNMAVNSVDWSREENRLATASEDGTVRIWNTQNGEELLMLSGHDGPVNQVAWSADGSQLATAGKDGTVRFWNTLTGELIQTFEFTSSIVWSLAWSPDGRYLATGSNDALVRLLEISSGQVVSELNGHKNFVFQVAWSPVDKRLATAGAGGYARIWNAAPSTAVLNRQGYFGELGWSSNSRYLACAGGDWMNGVEPDNLSVWDVSTGQLVAERLGARGGWVNAHPDYSPDDRLLLLQAFKGPWSSVQAVEWKPKAFVIDAQTGEDIKTFSLQGDGSFVRTAFWSPDGTRIAAGTSSGTVAIWDYQSGALLTEAQCGNFVNNLCWSPDGEKLAVLCLNITEESTANGRVEILNVASGETLLVMTERNPTTITTWVTWSPDGTRILSTGGDDQIGSQANPVVVWAAKTGKKLLEITRHTGHVWSGSWSPDGKRFATGSTDNTTRVWDAATGAELLTLSTPNNWSASVKWSPDGRYLAVSTSSLDKPGRAEVWRVWQSTEELIQYAREGCVFRGLTVAEREQFGLPPVSDS